MTNNIDADTACSYPFDPPLPQSWARCNLDTDGRTRLNFSKSAKDNVFGGITNTGSTFRSAPHQSELFNILITKPRHPWSYAKARLLVTIPRYV